MKRIIFLVLILVGITFAQSNNVNELTARTFYKDTLTTSIDTIDVSFYDKYEYYTISCYTTTGTDTIDVYVNQEGDGSFYTKNGLRDLTADTVVSRIIITTTPKQFQLLCPNPKTIRLISPDTSSSTVFFLSVRSRRYY
jgi:hypothetical protein